jgi:hypothetical protein
MKSNNIHSSHPDVLEAFRRPTRAGQSPSLGFRFTEAEERAMAAAIRKSRQFMRIYGQGREPYILDRRNYVCDQI